MLQEKDLKTVGAGFNALGAAINAELRNREAASTYTSAQRAAAQTVIDIMDLCYNYTNTFKNFRKTFIAVKLENAQVRDKKLAKQVDAILEAKGYVKVKTPQGLVVRMPREIV